MIFRIYSVGLPHQMHSICFRRRIHVCSLCFENCITIHMLASPTNSQLEGVIIYLSGRHFSSEKSPTITVASLFFFFFRQTTDPIVYVPLFTDFTPLRVLVSTDFTRFTFSSNFFRHCATFRKCHKAQRVAPFMYFSTMRLFKILKFFDSFSIK